jgi:hypothetical protein
VLGGRCRTGRCWGGRRSDPPVRHGAAQVAHAEAAEHVLGQLGRSHQQPAAVGQGPVQLDRDPPGQLVAEVQQDVAAQDQVQLDGLGDHRRPAVLGQVQVGEADRLPDVPGHLDAGVAPDEVGGRDVGRHSRNDQDG